MTASKNHKVGYGRPPEHSRFKRGHSGNPRGRPRKHRNFRTVLEESLQAPIDVSVNGRPRRMKRIDALVMTTIERAQKLPEGDIRAPGNDAARRRDGWSHRGR